MTNDSATLPAPDATLGAFSHELPSESNHSSTVEEAVKAPFIWAPTLYFAEGIPQYLVTVFSLLMFQAMGVPNAQITAAIGAIGFVWMVKPLWSPLLEAAPSKKLIVVTCQFLGGLAAGGLALILKLDSFFALGIAALTFIAIASATHDIAADGLYIGSLTKTQQGKYAGWLGCAYNVARIAMVGGLVKLVDYWQKQAGFSTVMSWQAGLVVVAVIMMLLGFYHMWSLPKGAALAHDKMADTLRDVIVTFFKKPGIWVAIAFIILFRLAEGQIVTVGPLFLTAARATGGLGLSLGDQGTIYGVYGTSAFLLGSVLGGYFAAWLGLKRALLILILAMNLPNAT
jgi:PAT family beta-lactamase induction signal transducer AmpG